MTTTLVFDVETVSTWATLSKPARAALLAKHRDAERRLPAELRGRAENHPRARAALAPWTAKAIVAAFYDPDRGRGRVFYEGDPSAATTLDGGFAFQPCGDEAGVLRATFGVLAQHPTAQLVTYHGRGFDGPFLLFRAAALGAAVPRNLVPNRYALREHADLHDLLGVYGAMRAPALEVVCEAFGIASPKGDLSGAKVEAAYRRGEILRIARYCAADARATGEVYLRMRATVLPVMAASAARKFG